MRTPGIAIANVEAVVELSQRIVGLPIEQLDSIRDAEPC